MLWQTLKHFSFLYGLLILVAGCSNDDKTDPPADGFDGFPNAENTGIQEGINLSPFNPEIPNEGNIVPIYESDVVLENLAFTYPGDGKYFVFYGDNVILRNCRIPNGVQFNGANCRIEYCDVTGGIACSGAQSLTIFRNEISEFTQGIYVASDSGQASDIVIKENYVHTPNPPCMAHSDGIQVRGVNKILIDHNTIDMGPWRQVCGLDAYTAAVFIQDANGGHDDVDIRNNYLNGGGRILLLTSGGNMRVTGNRFGRTYQYAVIGNDTASGDIVLWENNAFYDNEEPVNLE